MNSSHSIPPCQVKRIHSVYLKSFFLNPYNSSRLLLLVLLWSFLWLHRQNRSRPTIDQTVMRIENKAPCSHNKKQSAKEAWINQPPGTLKQLPAHRVPTQPSCSVGPLTVLPTVCPPSLPALSGHSHCHLKSLTAGYWFRWSCVQPKHPKAESNAQGFQLD